MQGEKEGKNESLSVQVCNSSGMPLENDWQLLPPPLLPPSLLTLPRMRLATDSR